MNFLNSVVGVLEKRIVKEFIKMLIKTFPKEIPRKATRGFTSKYHKNAKEYLRAVSGRIFEIRS